MVVILLYAYHDLNKCIECLHYTQIISDTTMFTHSARLANILMVVAALALCVSACAGPGVGLYSDNNSAANVAALTVPVTASTLVP